MTQKKKLEALNETLVELMATIEKVKLFDQSNLVLDEIMTSLNKIHPMPNLKAVIENNHKDNLKRWEPTEYCYKSHFGKNAPTKNPSNKTLFSIPYEKRATYFKKYETNRAFVIDTITQLNTLLENEYTIELTSKPKRITEATEYIDIFYFLKELNFPLRFSITLEVLQMNFSLVDKYNHHVVKEFKKSFLFKSKM